MFSVQSQVFSKNRILTEEVQLRIYDNKGAFYIEIEGIQEAMMTFVYAGEDKIIIDHTEVNPGNEGKGFGKKMVTKSSGICSRKRYQNCAFVSVCKKFF